jgi:hypothetical protein
MIDEVTRTSLLIHPAGSGSEMMSLSSALCWVTSHRGLLLLFKNCVSFAASIASSCELLKWTV